MLRDAIGETSSGVEFTPTWAPNDRHSEPRWRVVDNALREIAVRRAGLDADEARWLREAEALQIWHQLGMVSALDYLERVLGYSPRKSDSGSRVHSERCPRSPPHSRMATCRTPRFVS